MIYIDGSIDIRKMILVNVYGVFYNIIRVLISVIIYVKSLCICFSYMDCVVFVVMVMFNLRV